MIDELEELDKERIKLKDRRDYLIPIFLTVIGIFTYLAFSIQSPPIIFIGIVLSFLIHFLCIGHPFNEIKGAVKKAILCEFMELCHPQMEYSYQQNAAHGKSIAKHADLISFSSATEEDVLAGNHKGADFYISELNLSEDSGDDSYSVFEGILFVLTIPNKDFPNAEIKTGSGSFFRNLFGLDNRNEEFDFNYNTENNEKFIEQLGPLFPFIRHLSKSDGGLKIRTEKNRIIILMNSNMSFLDTPTLALDKSFFNKKYNNELSKQLNTLFFIVESFTNNLEKSEIVERLELKVLETIDRDFNL